MIFANFIELLFKKYSFGEKRTNIKTIINGINNLLNNKLNLMIKSKYSSVTY